MRILSVIALVFVFTLTAGFVQAENISMDFEIVPNGTINDRNGNGDAREVSGGIWVSPTGDVVEDHLNAGNSDITGTPLDPAVLESTGANGHFAAIWQFEVTGSTGDNWDVVLTSGNQYQFYSSWYDGELLWTNSSGEGSPSTNMGDIFFSHIGNANNSFGTWVENNYNSATPGEIVEPVWTYLHIEDVNSLTGSTGVFAVVAQDPEDVMGLQQLTQNNASINGLDPESNGEWATFLGAIGSQGTLEAIELGTIIDDLHEQLDTLEEQLNNTNATLQAEIDDLRADLNDTNADIVAIQADVNDLQAQIDAMNHATLYLRHSNADAPYNPDTLRVSGQAPSGAEEVVIRMEYFDWSLVADATVDVDNIGDNNHSYKYFFEDISTYPDTEPLRVLVKFYDGNGDWMTGYDLSESFNNLYLNHVDETLDIFADDIAQLQVDVDAINDTVENHTQQLSDINNNLTTIWTEIDYINNNLTALWENATAQQDQIDDLLDRVAVLEAEVEAIWDLLATMNFGTMNVVYFDQDASWVDAQDSVRVWGQAPIGADSAQVQMRFLDQTVYETTYADVESIGDNQNQYEVFFNPISGFPVASYQVHVRFYNDSVNMPGYNLATNFDTLLNEWNEEQNLGFGFISTKYFEVWNPQTAFTRPLSWTYTPEESGNYEFALVMTNSTNGEVISENYECQFLDNHQTHYFPYNDVLFNETEGTYTVHVEARECEGPVVDTSNNFAIVIDDLTNPWPEFGVYTDSSVPGYNQFENETQTYWTNSNEVELVGYFGNTTQWQSIYTGYNCQIGTVNEDATGSLGESQSTDLDDYECHWGVDLFDEAWRSFGTEVTPKYNFRICGTPLGGDAVCDHATIGYDTFAPVIDTESLVPGVFDAVSGNWTFSADVTDNGVIKEVEFFLINKTNASDVHPLGTATEPVGDTWNVSLDTAAANISDAYYNFSVVATDYANNTASKMIDPILDNTDPVIRNIDLPEQFLLGQEMEVGAYVTDNLAGVEEVRMGLIPYVCPADEGLDQNVEFGWGTSETLNLHPQIDGADSINIPQSSTSFEFSETDYAIAYNGTNESLSVDTNGDGTLDVIVSYGEPFILSRDDADDAPVCSATCDSPQPLVLDAQISDGDYGNDDAPQNNGGAQPATIEVELSLNETCSEGDFVNETGACRDGIWTADVQEQVDEFIQNNFEGLPEGVFFEAEVFARDAANNTDSKTNLQAETPGANLHQGYDLVITSAEPNPATAGQTVTVQGTLERSNSDVALNNKSVFVNDVEAPIMAGNMWAANLPANNAGTLSVDAIFTSVCENEFTDSTSVTVEAAPNSGGGGGGGGVYEPHLNGDGGDGEEPEPQPEPETSDEESDNPVQGSGNNDDGGSGEEPQEEPQPEPQEDNLLTGAVTGAGFFGDNWPWLALFGALVFTLFGSYFYFRR